MHSFETEKFDIDFQIRNLFISNRMKLKIFCKHNCTNELPQFQKEDEHKENSSS